MSFVSNNKTRLYLVWAFTLISIIYLSFWKLPQTFWFLDPLFLRDYFASAKYWNFTYASKDFFIIKLFGNYISFFWIVFYSVYYWMVSFFAPLTYYIQILPNVLSVFGVGYFLYLTSKKYLSIPFVVFIIIIILHPATPSIIRQPVCLTGGMFFQIAAIYF